MPGLELKNISKSYQNGRKVIRDFSLVVEGGEFVILAGPEGCGKTTLLRMIAGLEEITSGTLLIDGEDMTHAEPRERKLAMLFQNGVLYPGMSVEENLRAGAYTLKNRKEVTKMLCNLVKNLRDEKKLAGR